MRLLGAHLCGGAIYDETHVVTAAHCCVLMAPRTSTVVAGDHDLTIEEPSQRTHTIKRIVGHEDYDSSMYVNDVCSIEVEEPFEFTE